MPDKEGIFSNLKFTDIFFPAAATVASAYNPYIGRGLQTGMNLFNTFADFQNSLRFYKLQKDQVDQQEQAIKDAQLAADAYINHLGGRIDDKRGDIMLEEPVSQFTLHGEAGPFLPDPQAEGEQAAPTPQRFTAAMATGPQQDTLGLEQVFKPSPDLSNEIEMYQRQAANEELDALERLREHSVLNRGMIAAAPGAAAAQLGQGSFADLSSQFRDKARTLDAMEAFKLRDEMMKEELLKKQWDLLSTEEKQKIYDESNARQLEQAKKYAQDVGQIYDTDTPEGALKYYQTSIERLRRYLTSAWSAGIPAEKVQEAMAELEMMLKERDKILVQLGRPPLAGLDSPLGTPENPPTDGGRGTDVGMGGLPPVRAQTPTVPTSNKRHPGQTSRSQQFVNALTGR